MFSLAHIPSANMEGGGVTPYCSHPPGGEQNVLVLPSESIYVIIRYNQQMHLSLSLSICGGSQFDN